MAVKTRFSREKQVAIAWLIRTWQNSLNLVQTAYWNDFCFLFVLLLKIIRATIKLSNQYVMSGHNWFITEECISDYCAKISKWKHKKHVFKRSEKLRFHSTQFYQLYHWIGNTFITCTKNCSKHLIIFKLRFF